MKLETVEKNRVRCAVVRGDGVILRDAQSALEVLMQASRETGAKNVVIGKELVAEDFFVLSTGLAGEILQKYVNYGGRIAIFGDYARYTSEPLRAFIRESNRGSAVFFTATEAEAVEMLTR